MARRRFSEREVRDALAASASLSAVLRKLGLRPAGGNHRTIRRLIQEDQISTDLMDPNWANRCARPRTATPLEQILVDGSTYNRGKLKQRLYGEGRRGVHAEVRVTSLLLAGVRVPQPRTP